MDLIGKRFGRLVVVSESTRKGYVVCKCDCGNTHEVRAYNLTKSSHPTASCGCLRRETSSINGKRCVHQNSARRLAFMAKYGTNLGAIAKSTPARNNKSGVKGVWRDPVHGAYQAYITLRHKKYHLGTFHSLGEAANARHEAEQRYFAPILADALAEQ